MVLSVSDFIPQKPKRKQTPKDPRLAVAERKPAASESAPDVLPPPPPPPSLPSPPSAPISRPPPRSVHFSPNPPRHPRSASSYDSYRPTYTPPWTPSGSAPTPPSAPRWDFHSGSSSSTTSPPTQPRSSHSPVRPRSLSTSYPTSEHRPAPRSVQLPSSDTDRARATSEGEEQWAKAGRSDGKDERAFFAPVQGKESNGPFSLSPPASQPSSTRTSPTLPHQAVQASNTSSYSPPSSFNPLQVHEDRSSSPKPLASHPLPVKPSPILTPTSSLSSLNQLELDKKPTPLPLLPTEEPSSQLVAPSTAPQVEKSASTRTRRSTSPTLPPSQYVSPSPSVESVSEEGSSGALGISGVGKKRSREVYESSNSSSDFQHLHDLLVGAQLASEKAEEELSRATEAAEKAKEKVKGIRMLMGVYGFEVSEDGRD